MKNKIIKSHQKIFLLHLILSFQFILFAEKNSMVQTSDGLKTSLKFSSPTVRDNISNLKESATLEMAQKQKTLKLYWKAGFGESAFPSPDILVQALKEVTETTILQLLEIKTLKES